MTAVRAARRQDGPALREIERSAGARFHEVGLSDVADDEPLPLEELAAYAEDGRAWVAVGEDGQPIGYVLVDVVDGAAQGIDPGLRVCMRRDL